MLKLRTLGQPVIQSLNPGEYVPQVSYGDGSYEYVPTPNSPTTPLTPQDKALLASTSSPTFNSPDFNQFNPPAQTSFNMPGPGQPVGPGQAPKSGMIMGFTQNQIIVAGIAGLLIYTFAHKG